MLWRLDQNQNYMDHLRCYMLNYFKLSERRSSTSVVCSSKAKQSVSVFLVHLKFEVLGIETTSAS